MTATDELRCLLDERRIKWWAGDDERKTIWQSNGLTWEYFNTEDGDAWLGFLGACESDITTEQAVAATVGAEDTYTREECEASFVRGYSLGCLPVGSDPRWDENRQTVDEHMAELGWVRKDAAMLGRGTCHMRLAYEEEDADGCIWPDHYECDACGANVNGIMPYCDTEIPPNYCPNCGREVVRP
jgi:hypothetical protein